MKALIDFWKKDIINKLILLISIILLVGTLAIAYALINLKSDSIFYSFFSSSTKDIGIPTLAVDSTQNGTGKSIVLATVTPQIISTATPQSPIATAEQANETPGPTQTLELPSSTPSPTLITSPVASSNPNKDVTACIPSNRQPVGKVLDVIDGNTIKVMLDGASYIVRYLGIDVPKYRPVAEYYGMESDFKNAEYVFAKEVILISDTKDKDDSGRLLRYVKVGDVFVNYALVSQGFATASSELSACADTFKAAEQSASQLKIGLWMPTPTIPSP